MEEKKKKFDKGTIITIGITLIVVAICVSIVLINNNSTNETSYNSNKTEEKRNKDMSSEELLTRLLSKGCLFKNLKTNTGEYWTFLKDKNTEDDIAIVRDFNKDGEIIYLFFDYSMNEHALDLGTPESLYSLDNKAKKTTLDLWLLKNDVSLDQIKGLLTHYYINYDKEEHEIKDSFNVGETYADASRKITFLSLDDNYTGYNKYATVKDGYKVIRAEFEFENLSTSTLYASRFDFNCYADGYDCDNFYSVDDEMSSATLSQNKKTKGAVYFEVPKNANEITIEYEKSIYDDIIKFKVK